MDLRDVIDAFDRLVANAAGVAPESAVEAAATVARRARSRRGYLGETVVVALAGGTGSGKSSLVNAMAGEEVAPAGPRRPTTSRPLAWIPANPEPGLVRLLDDIGVDERIGHADLDWLAVIDLPDTDSVEADHRATVGRLLPEVDAVVWVVDPEKYQDRLLHAGYLRPLAAHADRFRFVLNQIDRVRPEDRPALVEDLAATLADDGIGSPAIVTASADPTLGGPEGIERLLEALAELGEAKRVVTEKILTDIDLASRELAEAMGIGEGAGVAFAQRWDDVRGRAAAILAGDVAGHHAEDRARLAGASAARVVTGLLPRGRPPTEVSLPPPRGHGTGRASDLISSFVDELAVEVGGETAAAVRDVAGVVEREVAESGVVVTGSDTVPVPPPPGWWNAAGWLRRMVLVLALFGAVWGFDRARAGSDVLPPVVVIVAAMAVAVVVRVAAVSDGGRRAVRAVEKVRAEVTSHLGRELDRRIGRPLRTALRERAGAGAALVELRLALESFRDREISA